jgi:hypothetical protein
LKCCEDDSTNRLTENLNYFEELTGALQVKYEIVFSKKDILIKKIKNGDNFDNLIKLGFDKEITFKNIVEFHIGLFLSIIKKKRVKYSFYCSNLVDFNESSILVEDIMNDILYSIESKIVFPNIFYQPIILIYFNFYDIKFIFY